MLNPRKLDIRRFIDEAQSTSGQTPLLELPRLAASCHADDAHNASAAVDWQLAGQLIPKAVGEPERWLRLTASVSVVLTCQRCLDGLHEALEVLRRIRFVATEAEAESLDEQIDEDVLALKPRLDALDLVEDELLLALPLVPRHNRCPTAPRLSVGEEALMADEGGGGRTHPFAALSAIKRKESGS